MRALFFLVGLAACTTTEHNTYYVVRPSDASTPEGDAQSPGVDASATGVDAASAHEDASQAATDAATPSSDAGTGREDASSPTGAQVQHFHVVRSETITCMIGLSVTDMDWTVTTQPDGSVHVVVSPENNVYNELDGQTTAKGFEVSTTRGAGATLATTTIGAVWTATGFEASEATTGATTNCQGRVTRVLEGTPE